MDAKKYLVVTTTDATKVGEMEDGTPIILPLGSVYNTIIWDGIEPYDPGPGFKLVLVDG